MNYEDYKELQRLNFEDILWVIFIFLGAANIFGDYNDKEYIKTKDRVYQSRADKIFTLTIEVTLILYLYFFVRNYNAYKKASSESQELFLIKLLGSAFLIAGAILLLYFQKNDSAFIGTPAL